jgi:hypothetical protein
VNPLGAVFDEINLDSASFIRLEQLKVIGEIRSGEDNTNNIHVLGNDVTGVIVEAPPKSSAGPGPTDWIIEYNDIHDCDFCVGLVSDDPAKYWPVSNVVVRGNKLGPMNGGDDAIRIHNWRNILIEDNEIFGVIEDGQHNDCLQSVWGGRDLVFRRNYLHDNNCQTFFLKDGYTENIVFEDNLFLRNRAGSAPVVGQIWPSKNVTIRNNTLWDDSAFYLRSGSVSSIFTQGPVENYEVTNNVMINFLPYDDNADDDNRAGIFKNPSILTENFNVFGGGWTWVPGEMGPNSVKDLNPDFINKSASHSEDLSSGDWRLAASIANGGKTYAAGITWRLAGRSFGIDAYGSGTDPGEAPKPPVPPPPAPGSEAPDRFIDDDNSIFEADIEWLAARGITKGCNPPINDMYCPDGRVTRGQMAAFLVRALGYSNNGGGDRFVDDDNSIFESDIDKLAAARVTLGCNPPKNDMYCPDGRVTRGQMAAFLHRALG